MPVTETIKPLEGVKKKIIGDPPSENEARKRPERERLRDFSTENQSRGDEGGTPTSMRSVKKPAPKKVTNETTEKKVKTPVNEKTPASDKPPVRDKTPKKTVQRAKASMSLNKTVVDKAEEEKKKRLSEIETIARKSSTMMKEPENVKLKTVRSKLRQQEKTKPNLSARRVPSAKKKNWATVVKKESSPAVKEEEPAKETMTEPETKTGEIQTEGIPISSCSFFEKLQQGVRAYFASRNSLTDEKNKKKVTEGGIRTGAGVAKGGKEETKARTQENKLKNKIKYWDSDLFYDRPRLKSNSEGQTNNFLNKNPKILRNFQSIKSKNLYHPKKHYVSIQIPRKGYFCRSFELGSDQSTSSPVTHGMASPTLPTKSEIQIARMASTGPKSSNIHKKGIKKSEKNNLQTDEKYSLTCDYLGTTDFILNGRMLAENLEKEMNRLALNWAIEKSANDFVREKESVSERNFEWETSQREYKNDMQTEIQKHDEPVRVESSETPALNSPPQFFMLKESKMQNISSFDILMNCLQESLNQLQSRNGPDRSPIITEHFETYPICQPSCKIEKIPEPESVINPFSMNLLNIPENKFCVATAFCKFSSVPFKFHKPEERFADLLLGDIDLHSEFQNYLKESKSVKNCNNKNISVDVIQEKSYAPEIYFDSVSKSVNEVKEKIEPTTELGSPPEEPPNESLVKKIQSEIESEPTFEEASDHGDLSFEKTPSEPDGESREKLFSHLISLLFKKPNETSVSSVDSYEKVSPMKTGVKTKKPKSKLQSSSFHNVPAQSKPQIKTVKSQTNQVVRTEPTDKKIERNSLASLNQIGTNLKWCPTWNKLAEVCGYFRKQIRKLEKKSKQTKNSGASLIISLLNKKLQDNGEKVDVTNLMKILKECFRPPPNLKSVADKTYCKKLELYVNTFQEILLSSMSIEQIVYLNTIINEVNKDELGAKCVEGENGEESATPKDENKTALEGEILNTLFSIPQKAGESSTSSSGEKIKPVEEYQKVKLETPTELKTVLKRSLENKQKPLDKILVNVKFCGNRVLVSDFSYIRDEKSLSSRSEVSELIVENISQKPSTTQPVSNKPPTSCKTKTVLKNPVKKVDSVKIVLKTGNPEKLPKKVNARNSKLEQNDTEKRQKSKDAIDTLFVDDCEELTRNVNTFEYNQERLKVQHPINAIIETSESKIIEHGDVAEDVPDNLEQMSERELFLQGIYYERKLRSNEPLESLAEEDFENEILSEETMAYVKCLSDLERKLKQLDKLNKVRVERSAALSEDATVKEKQKNSKGLQNAKKEVTAVKKTNSKVMKKMESKVLKKTPSTAIKNPNLSKTENAKERKKPTYASQLASAERLSRKPERFLKTLPNHQRQKDNPARAERNVRVSSSSTTYKKSAESLLYFNATEIPEVLSETPSVNATTAAPCSEEEKKNKQKIPPDNSPDFVSTPETIDKGKNIPVVIFSTPNGNDDVVSQFDIIRSESVLKTLSRSTTNSNNSDSVFESDLKFYPGRVQDNSDEQKPWVTFVLTPEQQAQAHLPNSQVQVVDKFRIVDESHKPEEAEVEEKEKGKVEEEENIEEAEVTEEEEEEEENELEDDIENPLQSIEKFIEELRQSRLRAKKQQECLEKAKTEGRNVTTNTNQKYKLSRPCRTSSTSTDKTLTNFLDTRSKLDKKTSGSEMVLAKVIVNILDFLLNQKEKELKRFQSDNEEMIGNWQDLEETACEMLDSVIQGVTQSERLVNKIKLILAVKAELLRKTGNSVPKIRDLLHMSKKIRSLKSLQKIKLDGPKGGEKEGETTGEVKKFGGKEGVVDVGWRPSVYFDAEEMDKEQDRCDKPSTATSPEPTVPEPTDSKSVEENPPKADTKLTPSDENLLAAKPITEDVEEEIFNKMHKNLQNNKIVYSMTLFDSFMNKKNTFDEKRKLQDDLEKVDEKTKKLVMEVEKSAWMKLHSLLDEVSRVYDKQLEENTTEKLSKTLPFMHNTQDVKNKMAAIYDSLSPTKIANDLCLTSVFAKLSKLRGSKNRGNHPIGKFLQERRSDSGFEIRAAKAVHNFRDERENHLEVLKNQIRDQRLFIEYLINTGSCSDCWEVNDVKNRVSEKIKILERSMSQDASQRSLLPSRLRKFLSLTSACRNFGLERVSGPRER